MFYVLVTFAVVSKPDYSTILNTTDHLRLQILHGFTELRCRAVKMGEEKTDDCNFVEFDGF